MRGRGEALRLVLFFLVSLIALESISNVSGEQTSSLLEDTILPWFYEQANTTCPNVRDTFGKKDVKKMKSCASSTLRNLTMGSRDLPKKELAEAVSRGICEKQPDILECGKPFAEAIEKCFPQGKVLVKAIFGLFPWICEDQTRFNEFILSRSKCLSQGVRQLRSCALQNQTIPPPKTVAEVCGFLAGVQDCGYEGFSKCEESTMIPDLVHYAKTALECSGSSTYHYFFDGWYILPILIFVTSYF